MMNSSLLVIKLCILGGLCWGLGCSISRMIIKKNYRDPRNKVKLIISKKRKKERNLSSHFEYSCMVAEFCDLGSLVLKKN